MEELIVVLLIGYKLVGDVDFNECKEVASLITPVSQPMSLLTTNIIFNVPNRFLEEWVP